MCFTWHSNCHYAFSFLLERHVHISQQYFFLHVCNIFLRFFKICFLLVHMVRLPLLPNRISVSASGKCSHPHDVLVRHPFLFFFLVRHLSDVAQKRRRRNIRKHRRILKNCGGTDEFLRLLSDRGHRIILEQIFTRWH